LLSLSNSGISRTTQRGAALISMLVIVILVTMVAARVQSNFYRVATGAGGTQDSVQARTILTALPNLAQLVLEADNTRDFDSYNDVWAQERPPMPVLSGLLSARLIDASSRFNVNALVNKQDDDGTASRLSPVQQQFIRYLQAIPDAQIDLSLAEMITVAITDWIDSDQMMTDINSGAEDDFYTSRIPGYRASNKPMVSISELRLVRHVTPEIYLKLAPWLVALPTSDLTINVNTATVPLLRSINANEALVPLSEDQVANWIQRREDEAFRSIDEFNQTDEMINLTKAGTINTEPLGVKTDLFIASADLNFDGRWFIANAIIERVDDQIETLRYVEGDL